MHRILKDGKTTFHLVRQIAEGGMGVVYEGRHRGASTFEKPVAIKTLQVGLNRDEDYQEKFALEAQLGAQLQHPNIVQTHHLAVDDEIGLFMVMDYVHGLSLQEYLRLVWMREEEFAIATCLAIATQLTRAVEYLHQATDAHGCSLNIIHRDICPGNILLGANGVVKLTDFGIAYSHLDADNQNNITSVGHMAYVSPEQVNKDPQDFRSDLYGIGAVLFTMLAGGAPRRVDTTSRGEIGARNGLVRWLALPADLPEDLLALLVRLLAKNPNDRYESATALGDDLEALTERYGSLDGTSHLRTQLARVAPFLYASQATPTRKLTKPFSPASRIPHMALMPLSATA